MGVVSRVAYKLPSVKALQEHAGKIAEQRDELSRQLRASTAQCDHLERERDELQGHCRRLTREAAEAIDRERTLRAESEQMLRDRDALVRERDELSGHCARLERELAERSDIERQLRGQIDALKQAHEEFVERALRLVGSDAVAAEMRREWDERARQNAMHFTNSGRAEWDEAEYNATGEQNIREHMANDMENICQGADPKSMRIVEIGCGAGRMTKPLAKTFGEVHAVDISEEMIRIARGRLAGVSNVVFHHNNGVDLRDLGSGEFDFALSFIVFQHIPSKAVIESYVREAQRVLKAGRLFKFQVQGGAFDNAQPLNTWLGASYTRAEAADLAARNGFELRYAHGEGTQDFWLWMFKKTT
jgi:ubiquinone/menaquinone biosynthesis C-methylase UbiE